MKSLREVFKKANFTGKQQYEACNGLCGTFALALYRVLKSRNTKCQIVAFIDGSSPPLDWNHFAIKYNDDYWDITGPNEAENIHTLFYTIGTRSLNESELMKELLLGNKMWGEEVSFSTSKLKWYTDKLERAFSND